MLVYKNETEVQTKFIYDYIIREIIKISEDKISFEVPVNVQLGRQKNVKKADIVIEDDKGNNFLVIEAKAPDVDLESYFDQIDSYAFNLETPLSILSNGNRIIVRYYPTGNKKIILLDKLVPQLEKEEYKSLKDVINSSTSMDANNIKIKNHDSEDPIVEKRPEIINYRKVFRMIHTKIRSIDKLDPTSSFDEFSKVLFIKIINSNLPEKEQLRVDQLKGMATDLQKSFVNEWFSKRIEENYPGIFSNDYTIRLSMEALIEILEILDNNFDLKDSMADIKGRAFEEFLPSQLRGKGLGQFFTPRPIVDFMVDMAEISIDDKVLDFAAGSGGFLIKAFDEKNKLVEELPESALSLLKKSREQLIEEVKTQIFGIDAEPRAVKTAKMNMLLWGDGKQIQHGNGLDTKDMTGQDYLAKEYSENDPDSGVDVILANPPFGSVEQDQDILSRYTLSHKKIQKKTKTVTFSKQKTENLFIEKAWKTLKPGGKLLIVLPEGIFSNKESKTRKFIFQHFQIDSIIKLPKHSFVMSGVDTINTVILIAFKNTQEQQNKVIASDEKTWISSNNPLTIKFASVNQIGIEPSGKQIKDGYKSSDLYSLYKKLKKGDYENQIADPKIFSQMEFGSNNSSQNWDQSMIKFLCSSFQKVPERIDPTYHFFYKEADKILQNYIDIPIQDDEIIVDKLDSSKLDEESVTSKDIERVYNFISVTKNVYGTVDGIKEKHIDDILATKDKEPKKISYGDVVYNPYRINTGSIIRINIDKDNLITSPSYVVIRLNDDSQLNNEYLVQLLKTPFMQYQIQVLSSGSIRDNLSSTLLKQLKIPNISKQDQKTIVENINTRLQYIEKQEAILENKQKELSSLLNEF